MKLKFLINLLRISISNNKKIFILQLSNLSKIKKKDEKKKKKKLKILKFIKYC